MPDLRMQQTILRFLENPIRHAEVLKNPHLDSYLSYATQHTLGSNHARLLDGWMWFAWAQQFSEDQDIPHGLEATKNVNMPTPYALNDTETCFIFEKILSRLSDYEIFPTQTQLDKTKAALLNLPQPQRIAFPFPLHTQEKTDIDLFANSLWLVSPFLLRSTHEPHGIALSASITTCLMQLLPHPPAWTGVPVFGKLSDETTMTMHAQGYHPMSVCSTKVRENMIRVHGKYAGPFLGFIHDDYHRISSAMISPESAVFLFQKCIPFCQSLKKRFPSLTALLTQATRELNHLILNTQELNKKGVRPFEDMDSFLRLLLDLGSEKDEGDYPLSDLDAYHVIISSWLSREKPGLTIRFHHRPRSETASFLEALTTAVTTLSEETLSDAVKTATMSLAYWPEETTLWGPRPTHHAKDRILRLVEKLRGSLTVEEDVPNS